MKSAERPDPMSPPVEAVSTLERPVPATDRDIDVLLAMYAEQCDQARHYESQQLTIMGFVSAAAGALTTMAAVDNAIDTSDAPIAAFIAILGALGLLASIAYYVRSTRHGKRAESIRTRLDEVCPNATIGELRRQGNEEASRRLARYRRLARLKLHHVWYGVNLAIGTFGLAFLWWVTR